MYYKRTTTITDSRGGPPGVLKGVIPITHKTEVGGREGEKKGGVGKWGDETKLTKTNIKTKTNQNKTKQKHSYLTGGGGRMMDNLLFL